MAVTLRETHDELCTACYDLLVWHTGYRLILVSDLEEDDAKEGLSLPWEPTWSYVELNDGSWEIGLPLGDIGYFQNLVRTVSNAKIDVEYNPLFVPDHDVEYFPSFAVAHICMDYFTLSAGPNTGLWRKPLNGDISTAPMVFISLRQPFVVAEVTISADWEMEWDQGGLVIFAGDAPSESLPTESLRS
ncbi:hypothetical protein F66182_17686, partial [Fusarium sp. NRRL 66182]